MSLVIITIIIFCLIAIFAIFPMSEDEKTNTTIFYLLGMVLIVLATFSEGDPDYATYLYYYRMAQGAANTFVIEPTFILIANLVSSPLMLFFVYAILGVGIKLLAIRQLTELTILSMALYCSYFFILHEMVQIRAGVASGLLLLAIKPIYERDWKRFLLITLVAYLFHRSAIVILPLWFFNRVPKRWMLALVVPVGYLIYLSGINMITTLPIPGIKEKFQMYNILLQTGESHWRYINVFNLVFLAKCALYYVLLWKYEVIKQESKYFPIMMNIYASSILAFLSLTAMPVMSFRTSQFLGVVELLLFTQFYYIFKEKTIANIFVVALACVLLFMSLFYNTYLGEI